MGFSTNAKASSLEPKACLREFHAHCVCVVGKNYRLQDIQLSKNRSNLEFEDFWI
jgi:hypothetical protein